MCENDFHVISRFRNDVILYYPTLEQKTGKRGHPKWFDGRIDFANLDLTRCKGIQGEQGKAIRIEGICKKLSKGMFPWPSGIRWTGGLTSGSFISLQTIPWMDARCWIITEPGFSWSFALEMESSMQESPMSVNRLQKIGFSLQCIACCCQLGQGGM